jgi:glycosyltransferase involved in cell wall biosynthesis
MQFLIDAHHIGARATGNETWALELAQAMVRILECREGGDEVTFAITAAGRGRTPGRDNTITISASALRRLLLDIPKAAQLKGADALLVQYTAPATRIPTVAAIHDLSFAHAESKAWIPATERARMRASIRWTARRAHRIVALSEYTANDLVRTWGIDPERIVVAHPAVGHGRAARLRARAQEGPVAGPPTLLAVGNVLPRKNLVTLARAAREVRARGLDVELHVVGQTPPAGRETRAALQSIGDGWIRFREYVDEDGLVEAYHAADLFCFPSLYEGFGLPVLEAMTAGVPTVASRATAVPEATGSAGLLVDPHSVDAWADAIELVLSDPARREAMRTRGIHHAASFDWATTAAAVLGALRSAAR